MKFYKSTKKDKQICLLCQHYCKLKHNQVGICGVNKNIDGEVKCLVYGYIAALNIDPVEKKPLYHFLPDTKILSLGTVGCNFGCPFCQNHGISQEKEINKDRYFSPEQIVEIAINKNCKSIAFTYNEPTIFYPYARDISILAKQNGLKTVFVSNGFESSEVIDDMIGIIDAANIDLKSFDKNYYKKELKGDLDKLLENIRHFHSNGIWIEITTLIIPTKNDSEDELRSIARFIASVDKLIPWHLSAFHPDFKETSLPNTPLSTLKLAKKIGEEEGLKNIYIGNAREPNPTHCKHCGYEIINRVTYKITKDERIDGKYCPKCKNKLEGVYMSSKQMGFAGSFYPKEKEEINRYIKHFTKLLENSNFDWKCEFDPKAIIVPHAGYIYSGFTANVAYQMIKKKNLKKIVVVGPSHKIYLDGASVSCFDNYPTPLGDLKVDKNYANSLIEKFSFVTYEAQAHQEHSTETQFPFIKYYFPEIEVIEIVYGKVEPNQIKTIIEDVLSDETNLVVISTDLSHFYTLNEAKDKDNRCLAAIDKLDLNIWNKGCEACGRVGVKAIIEYANENKLSSKLLDYRTSFDVTKDDKRVVGYMSALIG